MIPIQVMNEFSCHFVHGKLFAIGKGFVTGGFVGAGTGLVREIAGSRERKAAKARSRSIICPPGFSPTPDGSGMCGSQGDVLPLNATGIFPGGGGSRTLPFDPRGPVPCPTGFVRIGNTCQPIPGGGNGLPPTPRITTPAEGDFQAVSGAFGMPAMAPKHEFVGKFICPSGMVLGRDELCYPKAVLRRDSKFRKWRPGMRPILTGGERRCITRARTSINRAREAVGLQALK